MKSLSLQRPLVLLVIGTPGSGKSFFARQFADMFSAPIISFDQIQFRLFTEPTHSLEETALIIDLIKMQVAELAKTQKLFIIDGGVNSRIQRHEIQQFIKQKSYESLIVWVQTDETTAKKRSTRRDRRRSGDALNHSITEVQYSSMAKRLTPPQARENVVVISGKHTFSSQARAVLKRLTIPRAEQPVNQIKRHSKPPLSRPSNQQDQTPQRRNIILS